MISETSNCGQIIMLSGCRDDQTSADARITDIQGNVTAQGALTCALLNSLLIEKVSDIGSVYKKTLSFLTAYKFQQYPLLSTNKPYVMSSIFLS
jgi:hypothetical protein